MKKFQKGDIARMHGHLFLVDLVIPSGTWCDILRRKKDEYLVCFPTHNNYTRWLGEWNLELVSVPRNSSPAQKEALKSILT